ncbi:hypothetical protein HMI56_002272, partial [Coelomomyces lativittatus]
DFTTGHQEKRGRVLFEDANLIDHVLSLCQHEINLASLVFELKKGNLEIRPDNTHVFPTPFKGFYQS